MAAYPNFRWTLLENLTQATPARYVLPSRSGIFVPAQRTLAKDDRLNPYISVFWRLLPPG
jgi:hypothetical protein